MKAIVTILLGLFSLKLYAQTFSISKNEYYNANNSNNEGYTLSIKVQHDKSISKFYSASCHFGELPAMTDSVKLFLIESLLSKIKDTSVCSKSVEALSYRYNGRYNQNPKSTRYNLQIEALILINYIALSSEAVSYSPFPVIYDKKKNREITTHSEGLTTVINCYRKWFTKAKKVGMKQYDLPLIHKRFEWYGSLFQNQRNYIDRPSWKRLYSCQVLVKQAD